MINEVWIGLYQCGSKVLSEPLERMPFIRCRWLWCHDSLFARLGPSHGERQAPTHRQAGTHQQTPSQSIIKAHLSEREEKRKKKGKKNKYNERIKSDRRSWWTLIRCAFIIDWPNMYRVQSRDLVMRNFLWGTKSLGNLQAPYSLLMFPRFLPVQTFLLFDSVELIL